MIDGVPNKILNEVIAVYPEIILEAFNSSLQEGRFFDEWKKQRLVLLRSNGYNGKASGGNYSTTTAESHGWREQSLGEPVLLWERQVQGGRHPDYGGHQQ